MQEAKNNCKTFLYAKSQTIFKMHDMFCYVLYAKNKTHYITRFFMKIFNFSFIYNKHDTLFYVPFLYSKSQTLRKNHDYLRWVFFTKICTLSVPRFFIEFLKLAEVGGSFLYSKTGQFELHFLKQKS